jgi:hypothetical protein
MAINTTVKKTNGIATVPSVAPSFDIAALIKQAVNEALAKATAPVPTAVDPTVVAEIARLKAENAKLAAAKAAKAAPRKITIKVSVKGAVSVYGLGRFPVTLYKEQMEALLTASPEIRAFMKANESLLSVKGED